MRRLRAGLVLISVALLTACGGGTGAAPTAEAPAAATTAPSAAKPSPSPVASPSPATAAPSPAAGAAAPTPPAKPAGTVYVGNTDGEGVYIRKTPAMADRIRAYADGTALTIIGDEVDGDGQHWRHVRTPDGLEGYVPAQYTVETPP